jgi:uncharacterized membrane protein
MTELILGSILAVIVFIALFLAWYMIRNAKNKERLKLIEKGIDIKDFSSVFEKKNQFSWLKVGILITGIAVGALVVALIMAGPAGEKFKNMPGFSIAVILLSAGLSMIIANFVGRNKD